MIVVICIFLFCIALGKVFANWFFNINKRDRMLKAQTLFLERLCKKMGVPDEEIEAINKATEYKKIQIEK
jgi:hypothetical protein